MKKVLITGITGFVGSHLAEYCLDKKVELYGFKRYHLSNMKMSITSRTRSAGKIAT